MSQCGCSGLDSSRIQRCLLCPCEVCKMRRQCEMRKTQDPCSFKPESLQRPVFRRRRNPCYLSSSGSADRSPISSQNAENPNLDCYCVQIAKCIMSLILAAVVFWVAVGRYSYRISVKFYNSGKPAQAISFVLLALLSLSILHSFIIHLDGGSRLPCQRYGQGDQKPIRCRWHLDSLNPLHWHYQWLNPFGYLPSWMNPSHWIPESLYPSHWRFPSMHLTFLNPLSYNWNWLNPFAYNWGYLNPKSYNWGYLNPKSYNWGYLNPRSYNWGYLNPKSYNWGYLNPRSYNWGYLNPRSYNWSYLNPLAYNWNWLNPLSYNWSRLNPFTYDWHWINPYYWFHKPRGLNLRRINPYYWSIWTCPGDCCRLRFLNPRRWNLMFWRPSPSWWSTSYFNPKNWHLERLNPRRWHISLHIKLPRCCSRPKWSLNLRVLNPFNWKWGISSSCQSSSIDKLNPFKWISPPCPPRSRLSYLNPMNWWRCDTCSQKPKQPPPPCPCAKKRGVFNSPRWRYVNPVYWFNVTWSVVFPTRGSSRNTVQRTVTVTITDEEAKRILSRSKLYAIPMEMKHPPAILIYLRDEILPYFF